MHMIQQILVSGLSLVSVIAFGVDLDQAYQDKATKTNLVNRSAEEAAQQYLEKMQAQSMRGLKDLGTSELDKSRNKAINKAREKTKVYRKKPLSTESTEAIDRTVNQHQAPATEQQEPQQITTPNLY